MDDKTSFGKLLSWGELLRYAHIFRRQYENEVDRWLAGPVSVEEFLAQTTEKTPTCDVQVFRSRRIWRPQSKASLSLELVRFRFEGSAARYGCVVFGWCPLRFRGRETFCEGDGPIRSRLYGEEIDEEGGPFASGALSGVCSDEQSTWSWR